MKIHLILATYLGFLAANAAHAESVCADKPVLKEGQNPSLFFWNTRFREELTEDGSYGVLISEEVKKAWDPLNGSGVTTRKSCSRAFVKNGSDNQWLEAAPVPGILRVTEARLEQDYVLLTGPSSLALLSLSKGKRTVFASFTPTRGGCDPYLSAHASPSGAYIAQQTLTMTCGVEPSSNTVHVEIRDASAQLLRDAGIHTFNYGAGLNWTSETSFLLNDGETSVSFEVN